MSLYLIVDLTSNYIFLVFTANFFFKTVQILLNVWNRWLFSLRFDTMICILKILQLTFSFLILNVPQDYRILRLLIFFFEIRNTKLGTHWRLLLHDAPGHWPTHLHFVLLLFTIFNRYHLWIILPLSFFRPTFKFQSL